MIKNLTCFFFNAENAFLSVALSVGLSQGFNHNHKEIFPLTASQHTLITFTRQTH